MAFNGHLNGQYQEGFILHAFYITRRLYIARRIHEINRFINGINRLIHGITRLMNRLTQLISGWGGGGPGAAAGPPAIN